VAACQGSVRAVNYLLENGATVHVRDHFGHSPLWEAIRSKQPEVVQLLRSTGAYLSVSDVDDLIPKITQ
jgi:lysophospholipase